MAMLLLLISGCTSTPVKTIKEDIVAKEQQEFNLAINYIKAKRYDSARIRLEQIIRKYPDMSGAYTNLAILELKNQAYPAARDYLSRAIEVNPDSADAHHYMGVTYRFLGQFKQAEASYKKSIDLKPDYAKAYLNLGILYDIYLDKPEYALRLYQKYQELINSESITVKKWIAEIERRIPKTVNRIEPGIGNQHG
ncbi:MAG: tetratricopeptide repeat protein [Gammaproteobacteria bacterium]|nr:tetratricopeptide repeat protein [Gammaproteobacteria bacterium]